MIEGSSRDRLALRLKMPGREGTRHHSCEPEARRPQVSLCLGISVTIHPPSLPPPPQPSPQTLCFVWEILKPKAEVLSLGMWEMPSDGTGH